MSNILPSRPRQMLQRRSITIAIVASEYNPVYVDALVENASRELEVLSPGVNIAVNRVPGAFEIPLVVQEVAARGGIEAIIALGVIIKGKTDHADLIGEAITHSLLDAGLRYRLPVIHEVLLVADEEQAKKRCMEPDLNRGIEAARVAVKMVQALSEFKKN